MAKDTALSFRIEPRLKATLEGVAKADRRTVAGLVTMILEDWCIEQGHWPEDAVFRFGDPQPKKRKKD